MQTAFAVFDQNSHPKTTFESSIFGIVGALVAVPFPLPPLPPVFPFPPCPYLLVNQSMSSGVVHNPFLPDFFFSSYGASAIHDFSFAVPWYTPTVTISRTPISMHPRAA